MPEFEEFEYTDHDGDTVMVYDGGDVVGDEAALAVDVTSRAHGVGGLAYLPVSQALKLGRALVAWAEGESGRAAAVEHESQAPIPDLTRELLAEVRAIREAVSAPYDIKPWATLSWSPRRVERATVEETVTGDAFEVPTDAHTAAKRWRELQGGAGK